MPRPISTLVRNALEEDPEIKFSRMYPIPYGQPCAHEIIGEVMRGTIPEFEASLKQTLARSFIALNRMENLSAGKPSKFRISWSTMFPLKAKEGQFYLVEPYRGAPSESCTGLLWVPSERISVSDAFARQIFDEHLESLLGQARLEPLGHKILYGPQDRVHYLPNESIESFPAITWIFAPRRN